LLAPEVFRAEVLLQPRQEARGAQGISTVVSQIGLPELVGVSLGGGGDKAVAIATLKSRAVIEGFIATEGLLPALYADAWDPEGKRWKNADKAPNTWEAYNKFTASILRVAEDKKTGLVTLSVEWEDPQSAKRWAEQLVARTNEHLRANAISEGERNLEYLEAQAKAVGIVELRQSLFTLMETEQKKLMLAKGGSEFALKTIDPAVVPKKRVRPQRLKILALGMFLGGLLGVTIVLVRSAWNEQPSGQG
jgi:uncharacterized protein involved in exopolysaccharide biosynthesis